MLVRHELIDHHAAVATYNSFLKALSAPVAVLAILLSSALCTTAASLQTPAVFTQSAEPVRATNATLNAMGLPRGNSPTAVWFEWGTNYDFGAVTAPTPIGSGATVVRVSQPIFDLSPGTAYFFRAVSSNSFGLVYGAPRPFTTGMKVHNWGSFDYGYPRTPAGLTNLVSVAAGHAHSLGIRDDGSVVAWFAGIPCLGPCDVGQTTVPEGLSNVVAVAAGYSHSLALKEDGTVVAWGKHLYQSGPIIVPANATNVIAIAGGDSHSVALRSDGKVVAWGLNQNGQTAVPTSLSNVVAIAAGSIHNVALKADGTCVLWGSAISPGPPSSATNIVAVSAEVWHQVALKADGTVVCWGDSGSGKTTVPAGLTNVVAVAAGFKQSTALRRDGTVATWGDPSFVGSVPPDLTNIVSISGGDYYTVGLGSANLPPRVTRTSVTGEVDWDLTIPLSGWDPEGDPLSFRITRLPSIGALYQYTPSGRGEQILSNDTAVIHPAGVIYAPPAGIVGAPIASFRCIASDGELESAEKAVSVTIVPRPVISSLVYDTNPPRATFSFQGISNANYRAMAATSSRPNLWYVLGYATQSVSSGKFFYTDTEVTNYSSRFYRVYPQ